MQHPRERKREKERERAMEPLIIGSHYSAIKSENAFNCFPFHSSSTTTTIFIIFFHFCTSLNGSVRCLQHFRGPAAVIFWPNFNLSIGHLERDPFCSFHVKNGTTIISKKLNSILWIDGIVIFDHLLWKLPPSHCATI